MEYQFYTILGNFFYVVIFLLGLALGSFLNSWIWRRNENIRVVSGRSICPHCRRKLKWYENIPIFSYLFLRGRCRTCKNKIPPHFVWVELCTALLFLFVTWYHLRSAQFDSYDYHRDIVFVGILIVIFLYDLLYKLIPTDLVWLGVGIGFFFYFFCADNCQNGILLAILVSAGFFFLQYVISKGTWIGGGDIRLGVMMGVWLGWPNILVALMFAYIVGAIISVSLLLSRKKKMKSEIPFGTFLTSGTLFALLYGGEVVRWYVGLLR